MKISDQEYIEYCLKVRSGVLEINNFLFGFKKIEGFTREETEKEGRKKLFYFLQQSSKQCLVFLPRFQDDCYFGQGTYVRSKLIKCDRHFYMDLTDDLWTNMDNFWISNDWHKTVPRFHHQGDVYFVVDVTNFDWELFFAICNARGGLVNMKPESKAGFKKVISLIQSENVMVFDFFSKIMYASPVVLERVAYISFVLDDIKPWIFEGSRVDTIFGSQENLKTALDFNCEDYTVTNNLPRL